MALQGCTMHTPKGAPACKLLLLSNSLENTTAMPPTFVQMAKRPHVKQSTAPYESNKAETIVATPSQYKITL
eukprot:3351410-Amphidinium_carterae.3